MLAPVPPAVTGRVPVVKALVLDAYTAPPLVKVLSPVPPLATGNVPVTPEDKGNPVAFVKVPDAGVPKIGAENVALVNVLLVKVSVPVRVAKVPVVGKVSEVVAVEVKVVAKAPKVVKSPAIEILPPRVIVFPVLATPVPPYCPAMTVAFQVPVPMVPTVVNELEPANGEAPTEL